MVVGKTSNNIAKTDIFSKYNEGQVLATIFPQVNSLPCLICSPLRSDPKPSFSLYMTNGHVYYKDHGTNERGSLMDLLCKYWNCNLQQATDKLGNIFITNKNITSNARSIKTLSRKEADVLTKIEVVVRPWYQYDYDYWASYGVEKKWLRYAEIYPISHKVITKKESLEDKGRKYVFPTDKYAYCFVERKEGKIQLKIYQPFNKNGYKWCSKMDSSVIGLWEKIPQSGDRVVICSSLKDALCLSCQLHIPALCLQGEGYNMSDTAIKELKRRYKKVFICFDTDKPGLEDSAKLAESTGFTRVVPELGEEKDLSDYYKSLKDKGEFLKLEELFL